MKNIYAYNVTQQDDFRQVDSTGWIFIKFDVLAFFENLSRKQNFLLKYDRNNGNFSSRPVCTFVIITRSILLTIRNVSDKSCNENQSTHFMFIPKIVLPTRYSGKIWYSQTGHGYNKIRRIHFAYRIRKATDKHSEYVILPAFPPQQWVRERSSILHLYVHCLSC